MSLTIKPCIHCGTVVIASDDNKQPVCSGCNTFMKSGENREQMKITLTFERHWGS